MNQPHPDVVAYLKSKSSVWTQGTIRATASRLLQYSPCQEAVDVYNRMVKAGNSAYYIKLTFINLAALTEWYMAQGRATFNPYKKFLQENKQLFRNAYEDKYATITWEDFQKEYEEANEDIRSALALLGFGGCRLSELYSYDGYTVLGKGTKRRRVYLPNGIGPGPIKLSPSQIRRRLKHNPHSYRKLAADYWLRNGIDLKTVQVLLGHSSLASTQRYLRPLEQDVLQDKLNTAWRTA